jgi:hypothetical protein
METNKEQQIEELQKDIIDNLFNGGTYGLAEALFKAGYRKVNSHTNFEMIKDMGIEDFAVWLYNLTGRLCYEAWLRWLKSEVEE